MMHRIQEKRSPVDSDVMIANIDSKTLAFL